MTFRKILIAVTFAAAACSGSDDGLFPAETAQTVAKKFHEALVAGNAQAAAALARVPFRYKDADRIWPDAVTLEKNLAKEIPRIQHLLPGLDRIEAFSHNDLLNGRWPRRREIPKDRLKAETDATGVGENGWLVRVCSDTKPGYVLVLNQDGPDRLAVQALDI